MNRWIFVIRDSDEEFERRIRVKKWPIFNKTKRKKEIVIGDVVLFYKAGLGGQKFLGTCKIKSDLKKETEYTEYFEIEKVSVLATAVKMKDVIKELDFVKNKDRWGNYFQGGIRGISEEDFSVIIRK